jgi:hypothetical protein
MKATRYIQLVRLRKELNGYKAELVGGSFAIGISILLTIASCFTGEWEATAAALLMVVLCLGTKSLIQGQVDRAEEAIFQFRLKHSTYNL